MLGVLGTQRVFKELGSPKELSWLMDNPPGLLAEVDVSASLFSSKSEPIDCRAFLFDRAFILAVKSDKLEGPPVLFGDSDCIETEIEEKVENPEFSLKIYADLMQTYPSLYHSKSLNKYALLLTHISKDEDDEEAMLVDQAEIWFNLETTESDNVRLIAGLLQTKTHFLFNPRKSVGFGRDSVTSDTRTRKRATGMGRTRGRKNKTASRRSLGSMPFDPKKGRLSSAPRAQNKGLRQRLEEEKQRKERKQSKSKDNEVGEFKVVFRKRKKGIQVNDGRSEGFGVFVSALEPAGLADAAGVCVGDRIVSIDDKSLADSDLSIEDVKDLLQPEVYFGASKIVFSRTREEQKQRDQSTSVSRGRVSTEASEGRGKRKIYDQLLVNTSQTFEDIPDDVEMEEIFYTERRKPKKKSLFEDDSEEESDIEVEEAMRGVTASNFVPAKDKMYKRKTVDKNKILKRMRNGRNFDLAIFNERRLRKQQHNVEQQDAAVARLFKHLIENLETKRQKTVIYNLKEIYDTEKKYLQELEMLYEARLSLADLRKNVVCKELKNGKPFCEHYRVRLLCDRESHIMAPALGERDLDAVFLNLRGIMNIHERIVTTLRKELARLMKDLDVGAEASVGGILAVYVDEFSKVAHFFTMYTQYIQRYAAAMEKHKALRKENSHYKEGITMVERVNGIGFVNLIYKPLQRITKYPLFFDTLVGFVKKYINEELKTEAGSLSDFNSKFPGLKNKNEEETARFLKMVQTLQTACAVVHKVVDKVNVKVGDAANLEEMAKAYEEIGGKKKGLADLLQPTRRLKEKLQIYRFEITGEYPDDYDFPYLYVFNDLVVTAVEPSAAPKRRLSLLSLKDSKAAKATASVAKKAAGHLLTATLGRQSSSRLLRSFQKKDDKKGKKEKEKKKGKLQMGKRQNSFLLRKKSIKKTQRSSSKRTSRNSAGSVSSMLTRSKKKATSQLDLQPVSTLKLTDLLYPRMSTEVGDEEETIFVLSFTLEEDEKDKGSDNDETTLIKFWFNEESEREKVAESIESAKKEQKDRRKAFQKAKAKRKSQGENIQF